MHTLRSTQRSEQVRSIGKQFSTVEPGPGAQGVQDSRPQASYEQRASDQTVHIFCFSVMIDAYTRLRLRPSCRAVLIIVVTYYVPSVL